MYILVDFDHTLAYYGGLESQGEKLGAPIPAMVERVKRWLKMGKDVRLFTARASRKSPEETLALESWCESVFGVILPIQNWKDFECEAIWDDLAITVEKNTGWRWSAASSHLDPLTFEEEVDFQQPSSLNLPKFDGEGNPEG